MPAAVFQGSVLQTSPSGHTDSGAQQKKSKASRRGPGGVGLSEVLPGGK